MNRMRDRAIEAGTKALVVDNFGRPDVDIRAINACRRSAGLVVDAVLAAVEPDIRADERRRVRKELLEIAEEDGRTEFLDPYVIAEIADRIAPEGGDRG